jgi:hypothetical protein
VFTVCCVLSFVVGFAMLGALTFLPTYMQYVDGVSATTSGLRTLPMVAGMLSTSMGSGVLVGRTGSIAMRPDCQLDVAELWAPLRINRYQRAFGIARITDIGDQLGIPYEVLEPSFDRLVRRGYAQRNVDRLWLTPPGLRQVDFVTTLIRE